jgi:sigma-B regulation protein RsbQ
MSSALKKNNVKVTGRGKQPMLFAHGYGCDQNMWRFITPAFEERYKIVLFDHVGALAAIREPDRFDRLVLIGPSPRYINDGEYVGGFKQEDIEGLLDFLDGNHLGWSSTMAPVIMGNPERPELGEELTNSFCRTNPDIAKHFARVTFLSDNRADLPSLKTKALILQCSQDVIAPEAVGRYMHQSLPGSEFVLMEATGHCPNLSAPEETIAAMKAFLGDPAPIRTAA